MSAASNQTLIGVSRAGARYPALSEVGATEADIIAHVQ